MDTSTNQFPSLEYFLKMDYWRLRDAALLLLGIDPKESTIDSYAKGTEKIVLLDNRKISKYSRNSGYGRDRNRETPAYATYNKNYQKIIDLWELTEHEYEGEDRWISHEFTVSYILKWAERKKIEIIWLDWASKENLLPASVIDAEEISNSVDTVAPTSQQHDHPAKNPNHPSYAPELHAALAAWEALYLNDEKPDRVDHTTAVTAWFEKHWTQLTPTARKRLASVTNTKDNKNSGRFEEK